MSRRKKIKPVDYKYLRAKKREKIRKTVDYSYLAIMLICILVCGLNQPDSVIVGWGLIFMGAISIPVAVFHLYINVIGWKPLFWYDDPEVRDFISTEMKERDLVRDGILRWFETIILVLLSVGLPIEGVLKLLSVG